MDLALWDHVEENPFLHEPRVEISTAGWIRAGSNG